MTPTSTLVVAREFFHGYERCWGSGLPAENGKQNPLIPGVVCLAFACELGLKSVLAGQNTPFTGHSLNRLFEKLNEANQRRIIQLSTYNSDRFQDELVAASNAFTEWRYIHEKSGEHTTSVQFLLCLYSAVESLAVEYSTAYIRSATTNKEA